MVLPVVVVLVDDGDGAWVQVDPQEVGPHPDAALQSVAPLDLVQLTVHRIHPVTFFHGLSRRRGEVGEYLPLLRTDAEVSGTVLRAALERSMNTHVQLVQIFKEWVFFCRTFLVGHQAPLPEDDGTLAFETAKIKKTGVSFTR